MVVPPRAAGDLRANIAAILSGGDEEKPRGGSASSPYAFRAGYAFSAASAPSSPAGEDQDLLAARRGAWAAQSASRAERYREEGDSRRRGLETPPSSLGRDPRAFFGGSPSHGADSASAFGAVVATLESAKKLRVGAEVSSLTAGSPSALLPSRARGGSTPGARAPRALDPAAAAAALGASLSAAKGGSRPREAIDAAADRPPGPGFRRALRWAEGDDPGYDPGSTPGSTPHSFFSRTFSVKRKTPQKRDTP